MFVYNVDAIAKISNRPRCAICVRVPQGCLEIPEVLFFKLKHVCHISAVGVSVDPATKAF